MDTHSMVGVSKSSFGEENDFFKDDIRREGSKLANKYRKREMLQEINKKMSYLYNKEEVYVVELKNKVVGLDIGKYTGISLMYIFR